MGIFEKFQISISNFIVYIKRKIFFLSLHKVFNCINITSFVMPLLKLTPQNRKIMEENIIIDNFHMLLSTHSLYVYGNIRWGNIIHATFLDN